MAVLGCLAAAVTSCVDAAGTVCADTQVGMKRMVGAHARGSLRARHARWTVGPRRASFAIELVVASHARSVAATGAATARVRLEGRQRATKECAHNSVGAACSWVVRAAVRCLGRDCECGSGNRPAGLGCNGLAASCEAAS